MGSAPSHKKSDVRVPKWAVEQDNLNKNSNKFPNCIGRFPECKDYTADMSLELRPECKFCPFRK